MNKRMRSILFTCAMVLSITLFASITVGNTWLLPLGDPIDDPRPNVLPLGDPIDDPRPNVLPLGDPIDDPIPNILLC